MVAPNNIHSGSPPGSRHNETDLAYKLSAGGVIHIGDAPTLPAKRLHPILVCPGTRRRPNERHYLSSPRAPQEMRRNPMPGPKAPAHTLPGGRHVTTQLYLKPGKA